MLATQQGCLRHLAPSFTKLPCARHRADHGWARLSSEELETQGPAREIWSDKF